MIALWVVLALVFLALVVAGLIVLPRRRSSAQVREGTGTPSSVADAERAPSVLPVEEPRGRVEEEPAPLLEQTPLVERGSAVAAQRAEPAAPPELRERLGKTRGLLSGYLRSLRTRGSVDESTWDDLEEALLRADVGVATTNGLIEDLRARVGGGELRGPDAVLEALREDLRRTLDTGPQPVRSDSGKPGTDGAQLLHGALPDGSQLLHGALPDGAHLPDGSVEVWLFVGVNGVGKTTTIGKVARAQALSGRSVLLAAGDTFRAAAADQLEKWGERVGVEVVRGSEGADPSAVVYDAVRRAAARGSDLVLADTAGRLHTKVNLVEELKKIRRVADRAPGHVTEVLLVLDATTGQNGLVQARQFLEAVGVSGVVLTKLDGTAKGGIVVAIQRELGLPVKLVGIGEGADDLVPFEPKEFVDALFD